MGLNLNHNLDEGLIGFPVLGDPPFKEIARELAIAELRAAGLPRGSETWTTQEQEVFVPGSEAAELGKVGVYSPDAASRSPTEWTMVYSVTAELHGWEFYRAWCYWIVAVTNGGRPMKKKVAEEFNRRFFKEARVEGCAGGQEVHGSVRCYHVDTPHGLKALVGLLTKQEEEYQRRA